MERQCITIRIPLRDLKMRYLTQFVMSEHLPSPKLVVKPIVNLTLINHKYLRE